MDNTVLNYEIDPRLLIVLVTCFFPQHQGYHHNSLILCTYVISTPKPYKLQPIRSA